MRLWRARLTALISTINSVIHPATVPAPHIHNVYTSTLCFNLHLKLPTRSEAPSMVTVQQWMSKQETHCCTLRRLWIRDVKDTVWSVPRSLAKRRCVCVCIRVPWLWRGPAAERPCRLGSPAGRWREQCAPAGEREKHRLMAAINSNEGMNGCSM